MVVQTQNWARLRTYPAVFLCSKGHGVITMNIIGKTRRLHGRKNKSEREISRITGLSRNTVSKWLRAEIGTARSS